MEAVGHPEGPGDEYEGLQDADGEDHQSCQLLGSVWEEPGCILSKRYQT